MMRTRHLFWTYLALSSAISPCHGATSSIVKLSYDAPNIKPKTQEEWESIVGTLSLDATGMCHALAAGDFSCHANDNGLHATLFYDASSKHVAVEARMSSRKGASFEEMQDSLIDLALNTLPSAMGSLSSSPEEEWSILSPNATVELLEEESSLYNLVLANPGTTQKKRISQFGDVSVWTYVTAESDEPVQAVFIKNTLRHISTEASVAHAEAFVHPAMISHNSPKRVLLISDMPFAPLQEILKYTSLEHVDVVGTTIDSREVLEDVLHLSDMVRFEKATLIETSSVFDWSKAEVSRRQASVVALDKNDFYHESYQYKCFNDTDKYAPETPEAFEERKEWLRNLCDDDAFARETQLLGLDWEREVYCKDNYYPLEAVDDGEEGDGDDDEEDEELNIRHPLAYDIIMVDVPYYDQEALTFLLLHRHLAALAARGEDGDALLVMSAGAAPTLQQTSSSKKNAARDVFLRQVTRPTDKGGLSYQFATVYDESLAGPLSTAFILAFQWEFDEAYNRFFRTNSATFDLDMLKRLVPNTGAGKVPTLMYDGPTHVRYQTPSRVWENWYCTTSPGKDLPGCTVIRNWMFDPSRHHTNLERKVHPVKGRSLFSAEHIPKDHFVNFDDVVHSLHIDETEWQALVHFVEEYPDAELYRQLRDFIVIYGFEAMGHSMTGWAVSAASTNTFTNHACTNEDRTVTTTDYFMGIGEDGFYNKFSPVASRRPRVAAYATLAKRDIQPGDEIQINYQSFRSDFNEHPYFDVFLTGMCSTGVGMVPVPDLEMTAPVIAPSA